MKFKYKRTRLLTDKELKKLGRKGWELIAVDDGLHYFAKIVEEYETDCIAPEKPRLALVDSRSKEPL